MLVFAAENGLESNAQLLQECQEMCMIPTAVICQESCCAQQQELEVLKERVTQLERLLTAVVKGVWYRPRETTYNQLLNTTLGEGCCGYTFETAH